MSITVRRLRVCYCVGVLVLAMVTPSFSVALLTPKAVVTEASPYQPTLISLDQNRVAVTVPAMPRGTMLTLQAAEGTAVAALTGNNRLVGTPFHFWIQQAGVHLPKLDTDFMLSVTVPSAAALPSALGLYYYHEPEGVWQRVLGELVAETATMGGRFARTGLFALLVDVTAPEALAEIATKVVSREVTLSGRAEPFAFIQLFFGDRFLGDVQADIRGNYSLSRGLPPGQNVLRMRQIDQAGNISEQSLALSSDQGRSVHIELVPGSTQVKQNRALLLLDVPPRIVQGRTMVPLRFVAEALGATVTWQGDINSVVVSYGTTTIYMTIGSPAATVNGNRVLFDVAPFVERGRTLVPLRFLAETLGFEVRWHGLTNRIEISR